MQLESIQCTSKRTERKGKNAWCIHATSTSAQDFFQLKHDDSYITAYVNTVRAGPVRTGKPISNPRSMTFSRLDNSEVPPLPATYLDRSSTPAENMEVSEEERAEAQKHSLRPQKDQQPAKKPAWCNAPPSHMNRVPNEGGGGCWFLAAAD